MIWKVKSFSNYLENSHKTTVWCLLINQWCERLFRKSGSKQLLRIVLCAMGDIYMGRRFHRCLTYWAFSKCQNCHLSLFRDEREESMKEYSKRLLSTCGTSVLFFVLFCFFLNEYIIHIKRSLKLSRRKCFTLPRWSDNRDHSSGLKREVFEGLLRLSSWVGSLISYKISTDMSTIDVR